VPSWEDDAVAETASSAGTRLADAALGPDAARGRTTIADRVVVKVARRAAAGVSTVVPGGLVGSALPAVEIQLAGLRARVRARVASTWPEPAADVAARVRDAVRGELERIVGVRVDDLVVTVAAVRPPERDGRRVR
jgi:uncharacterized alkaline shock family protein YloU